jgi:UTP--glucose-1-phosphate uridylyltransferase
MKVRKAVIPAAGLGTRFLPVTKAQPKEMLPVVDKPTIQYVVEEAVRAGIDDILMITGRGKRSLEDHFDRNIELELELEERGKTEELKEVRSLAELAKIHFIRQGEALGLGHAVGMASKHVGDQPFVVLLGDDLIDERVLLLEAMIAEAERVERSVIALMEVDDPSAYGCARVEPADGGLVRIREIVEKPSRDLAPSNLAVMGRYVFTPEIFDAIARVQPGVGGEIQLTDAIAQLLDGSGVYGYPFSEGRFDTGNKLDYLRANIELAARRDDLGPGLRSYLADFVKREGLVT